MLMFIQTFAKPFQVFADYTFGRQYLNSCVKIATEISNDKMNSTATEEGMILSISLRQWQR